MHFRGIITEPHPDDENQAKTLAVQETDVSPFNSLSEGALPVFSSFFGDEFACIEQIPHQRSRYIKSTVIAALHFH